MIQDFYIGRLEANWTLRECDETDFLHWCELLVYKENKEYTQQLVALDNTDF